MLYLDHKFYVFSFSDTRSMDCYVLLELLQHRQLLNLLLYMKRLMLSQYIQGNTMCISICIYQTANTQITRNLMILRRRKT